MTLRLAKVEKTDLLHLFVLATAGVQVLTLIWLSANTLGLYKMSNKPTPSLVQMSDGRPLRAIPIGNLERTPATIQRFVGDTFTLMFNWSGTLPPTTPEEFQSPKPEPGKKLSKGANLVATASWQAGFGLSEDYRTQFLAKVALLTPREVFSGGTKVVLITRHLSEPQLIEAGKWKMQVVGDLVFFNAQDNSGNSVAFNKEVFIRSVDPPSTPLMQAASDLEKTIYGVRQAGLEIYAIRELERGNL